ncbi:MAG: hypothetical protein AAF138_02845 [Planctomycetota bacterium]
MTTQAPSITAVRHRRLLGQAGAAVFVLATAAVVVFGLPGADLRPVNTTPRPAPEQPADATVAAAPNTDFVWISGSLGVLGGVEPIEIEEPVKPVDEPTPTDVVAPTPAVPAEKREIRYLGSIVEPGRRVALLTIDDRQRFLHEGRASGDVQLLEVGADFVRLDIGGVERRLDRASRSADVVTEISASGAAPGGIDRNAGRPSSAADAARRRLNPRERPDRQPAGGRDR